MNTTTDTSLPAQVAHDQELQRAAAMEAALRAHEAAQARLDYEQQHAETPTATPSLAVPL